MFDLGWSKVLILAVVAIVVVGPKELPSLLRTLGQFIAQLRRHASEFRAQFDEAMRSTELDQIRRDVEAIKTDAQASLQGIGKTLEQDLAEAKASVEQAVEAKPAAPGSETPTEAIAQVEPSSSAAAAADVPHLNGSSDGNHIAVQPPLPELELPHTPEVLEPAHVKTASSASAPEKTGA